jgi:hypothetical protein
MAAIAELSLTLEPMGKVLKQKWTIEEMSIFSKSSNLEWRAGLSDIIVKGALPARFGFIESDSPALHSKWLLLLKIEISLVVNFCFITN